MTSENIICLSGGLITGAFMGSFITVWIIGGLEMRRQARLARSLPPGTILFRP